MGHRLFSWLCILSAFLAIPLAHSLVGGLRQIESFWIWTTVHQCLGFAGIICIVIGNSKDELQSSVWGFIGGNLVFAGFFEFAFAFLASILQIQPVLSETTGNELVPPSLQINEASFLILFPLLLIFAADPQVRCSMILFLRRSLRVKLNSSAQKSSVRPYSRIAATETIFVIWTIYSISVICMDPRILGPSHWVTMVVYTTFLIWPLYLTYRISQIKKAGFAFRYAIPIGVLYWTWVEALASMNLITEFYLHPTEFPVACSLLLALTLTCTWVIYRWENHFKPSSRIRSSV